MRIIQLIILLILSASVLADPHYVQATWPIWSGPDCVPKTPKEADACQEKAEQDFMAVYNLPFEVYFDNSIWIDENGTLREMVFLYGYVFTGKNLSTFEIVYRCQFDQEKLEQWPEMTKESVIKESLKEIKSSNGKSFMRDNRLIWSLDSSKEKQKRMVYSAYEPSSRTAILKDKSGKVVSERQIVTPNICKE